MQAPVQHQQLERQTSLSWEDMDVETCWRGKEVQWKSWKGRPRGLDCYSKKGGSHCRLCAGAVLLKGEDTGSRNRGERGQRGRDYKKQMWLLTERTFSLWFCLICISFVPPEKSPTWLGLPGRSLLQPQALELTGLQATSYQASLVTRDSHV